MCIRDSYCSVDNDILISCGGGEMMCETMNFVDFEKIKSAEPKWYMGYSEMCIRDRYPYAILLRIYGLVTVYFITCILY